MSIPIDRLYNYIESVAQEIHGGSIVIYRFYPHGSKKIEDLDYFRPYDKLIQLTSPNIYCHDQEPLDYSFYINNVISYEEPPELKLDYWSIYNKHILVHSEQRSSELNKHTDKLFVGAYYWSHAVIALDWFRYAKYEKIKKRKSNNIFLIYNRAWSGTREYRLKFVDLLIKHNLINRCFTTFNPIEPELNIHYSQHTFRNFNFVPTTNLESCLPLNTATSCASADYVLDDYLTTDFEVVLETLFDDTRLHLTEKALRPIALGQPFLLAATHSSLEYLRSYGFKTFATVIDESYDTIEDPALRLEAIVKTMAEIASWTDAERTEKMSIANRIAEYNRQHFFSKKFFDNVVDELKINLSEAITTIEHNNTSNIFINTVENINATPELARIVYGLIPKHIVETALSKAEQYYKRILPKD